MKALTAVGYGPPDTFRIAELPIPEPGPGQIQVRVAAASLNPADLLMTSGAVREMLSTDFPYVPGSDFGGTVTTVGPGVTEYLPGDEVFGFGAPPAFAARFTVPAFTTGAMAEYAVFQVGPFVAGRPAGLRPDLAAALSSTGMIAIPVLAEGDFRPSERVLVVGATGGIGSIVVPMLVKEKVQVIATMTSGDEEYLGVLGATEWIDYLAVNTVTETLRRCPDGVDAVVNTALAGQALIDLATVVRPGGRLLSTTNGTPGQSEFGRDDLTVISVNGPTRIRPDTFPTIAARAVDGTLPDPITRRYGLDDAVRAYQDFVSVGHVRGKFVVAMPEHDGA